MEEADVPGGAASPEGTQLQTPAGASALSAVPGCVCGTACTEGDVNGECPVCGGEGADWTLCEGTQGEPVPFAINDTFEVDGITYKEVGADKVRLMDGKSYSGNLEIPEWVKKPDTEKEYQVVSIEGWAFNGNQNLTGITFPDSIKSIGTYAFYRCTGLTGSLILPENLINIEGQAFGHCSGLSGDLDLPDSLTDIGEYAFYECRGFNGNLVLPAGLTEIKEHTFYNCIGIQGSVSLPDTLARIESVAFYGCNVICETTQESVAALVYNSGYSNILLNGEPYQPGGTSNFSEGNFRYEIIDESKGYARLSSVATTLSGTVDIPATVEYQGKTYQITEIGNMAFFNKSGMTGVNLPEGLLHIDRYAFADCANLRGQLKLPGSLRSIGECAFQNCGLRGSLKLPEGLTSIGKRAFMQCRDLSGDLTLPSGLTCIENQTFFDCSGFNGTLTLQEGLQRIGEDAFYNCQFKGTLDIPDSVVRIGSTAFQVCSNISEFHVGKGLQIIGGSAFPTNGKLTTDSPRVQLVLIEYLNLKDIPTAYWDGTEDVPGGAIATVKQDIVISGNRSIGTEAQVTIAEDATVAVEGSLVIDGTVTVKGFLAVEGNGTIDVTKTGQIIRREQQELTLSDVGTKTYGEGDFSLAASGGSGVGAVAFKSSDPSVLSILGATASIRRAGTVTVTATKAEDYTFKEKTAELILQIEKKEVAIQAEDATVKKDEAMPEFTYLPVELAYQDRIEKGPAFSCTAADTGTIGEYSITLEGAVVTNAESYIIQYIPGVLKVTDNLYLFTVNNPGDGITADGEYRPGNRVPIHAGVYSGYLFNGWTSDKGGVFDDASSADTIFTMPASDIVLTANWKKEGSSTGGTGDDSTGGTGDDSTGGIGDDSTGGTGGDSTGGTGDDSTGGTGGDSTGGTGDGSTGGTGGDSTGGTGDGSTGGTGGDSTGGTGGGTTGGTGGDSAGGIGGGSSSGTGSGSSGSHGGSSSHKGGSGLAAGQAPFSLNQNTARLPVEAVYGTVSVKGQTAGTGKSSGTVTIEEGHISQAVLAARETAAKRGVQAGDISVVIHVASNTLSGEGDMDVMTLNLPEKVQDQIVNQKISRIMFMLDAPHISVGLDLAAVTAIKNQVHGDAQLIVCKADVSSLCALARDAVGKRPCFELKIVYDNGMRSMEDLGTGRMDVAIPYTVQKGEAAGGLWAVCIDGDCGVQYLIRSVYNGNDKMLRFSANRLSLYGIGYKAPASYRDVKNCWAKEDIAFADSRGLISGIQKGSFAPDSAITREAFIDALERLAGREFADDSASGDSFLPGQALTRQEAALVVEDCAKAAGISLAAVWEESAFVNWDSVSGGAAEAVKRMQAAGIMNGKDGSRLDPAGYLTRAEACNLLRCYTERAIGPAIAWGWTMNASVH